MSANFDREDIRRTAQIFHDGDVFELRIPKTGKFGTISGYFDKSSTFIDSTVGLSEEGFPGYYFTLNPVHPDLIARSANKYQKYAKDTTADSDILRRSWLPVDLDPVRPAGMSSSEEEHDAALQRAIDIEEWLISGGWPAGTFIRADSGNGGHLAARIDLPNDEASRDLVKHCLEALDFIFSDEKVKVDTSTFNAARIWKIYGTMARKGSDTADRPHRLARLIEVPETVETVSREQLEALVAILPKVEPIKNGNVQPFDPVNYAEEHGAYVTRTKTWNGWQIAILDECPFDSSHHRGEACLMVHQSGARKFACKHDSCKNHDWYSLKALWGSPGEARKEESTHEKDGLTVIDAIRALNAVCDGAATKDGTGFNKFDREEHEDLIEKAINDGYLSPKEEKTAYRFLKKYKKQLKGLDISYDDIGHLVRDESEHKPEVETIPEDIEKDALNIAENGKPLDCMLQTFEETHKGDRLHAESQFIGFGLQSACNTKGVFGTWDGPSGKGKSDGAKACVRQLPEEYTIISSVTAKSLYRRAENGGILPGSVLFLDDKNIEAGSDLEETLKRIQTFFQEGAEHETIDGKGGYLRTKLPERLAVVRTYVDSNDTDPQLKNRSMDFGVDSSSKIDEEVCDLVLKLGEDGQTSDMVTRQTLICRALWRDIKSHVYRVKHPAASKLIEFSDVSNRRNPSLFLDLVTGLACINHRQRLSEDGPNGEKILYANFEDYKEAERLFNSQGDYLGTRLDKSEFEAVQYIKDQGPEGATINGIFYHLAEKFPNDGWNGQKARRLMDGRPERDSKGLADTVPGVETRWDTNSNGSKTKRYVIPGELSLGVQVTIHDPRTKIVSIEDLSHLSHRSPTLGKELINSSIPPIPTSYPKYPNKEKDREEKESDIEGKVEPKVCSENNGVDFGKSGKTGQTNEAIDREKAAFPDGEDVGIDGKTGIGPHPRRSEPTPTTIKKVRIVAVDGYRTQIQASPGKWVNHLYDCGEVVEVDHRRAQDLIKRCIAEAA